MFLHDSLSGLSSDVERLNGECSKKYVSFYSDDFKLIGLFFKHGRSLLNKKGYQEINLLVRIQLSSRSPDLSLERANAIQDGSKSIKNPHKRAFLSLGSRGSLAYPFLSPHRLVGVLLRLLTSYYC
ncbi:hypothetical protein C3K52_20360 [Citrobacter freundii]|nr:hypothetical protein C3K52_20360 [Citrobacter freundii]